MVDTFLQTFQGRFLLYEWMRPRAGYIGYFIGLRFVCLLPGRHLLSVSPTVLLLVTNIAQSLDPHHHHLLSLPSVSHCQSPDSLSSPHQPLKLIKRGISQSSISRTNFVWLAALWLVVAHWELLKLKMWKWTNSFELKLTMRIFRGKSRR